MSKEILELVFQYFIVFNVLAGVTFACIYFSIVDYKTRQLKLKFLSNLSLEERKLIDRYNAINYFNYRRQLKRVKKNFNTNNDNDAL